MALLTAALTALSLEVSGPMWAQLDPAEVYLAHVGPAEVYLAHVGPVGPSWAQIGLSGPMWAHTGPIGPGSGYVSKYADGVFERTIQARIELGYGTVPADWRDFDGYFAGLNCTAALAGTTLYARPGAGHRWERLLYSDCSGHASTTEHFLRDGILGEVDHATFTRWYEAGYHTGKGMPIEVRPVEAFYNDL